LHQLRFKLTGGSVRSAMDRNAGKRTRKRLTSKLAAIELSDDEERQLLSWSRQRGSGRTRALRARIVLRCRKARSNREVARKLGITTQTVGKWRRRFSAARTRGLLDQPRSGAPRSISDQLVEAVLAKTLHEHPPDAARWSSRRLASVLGISQRAVLRIWRDFDLGSAVGQRPR
jgi:transposase